MKFPKNIPLYIKIVLGMLFGVLAGVIFIRFSWGVSFIQDWVSPWGKMFIRLLKMIAVPLVFFSLLKGITSVKDVAHFSSMGIRTMGIYIGTTVFAIVVGVSAALILKPGKVVNLGIVEITGEQTAQVSQFEEKAGERRDDGPLAFLEEFIPDNVVKATTDNGKMLQVIFFAILFGVAIIAMDKKVTKPFVDFFDSVYHIILKIVDYIIRMAPYGVFALMTGMVADYAGNLNIFTVLAVYTLVVAFTLLILIFGFYPLLVMLFTKIPVSKFMNKMYPVQMFAFTTSSSAATLPLTIDNAENNLGVSEEVSSFVLPVGTTVNMDGTSCYQAIAVIFIAQVLGINLGLTELLSIILLTTISSIGTPAIPGGSYVIMTMVLTTVGIPAEGLALILGVDRPLDMLRTAVNVTGDTAVAAIIDENKKDKVPHLMDYHETDHNT